MRPTQKDLEVFNNFKNENPKLFKNNIQAELANASRSTAKPSPLGDTSKIFGAGKKKKKVTLAQKKNLEVFVVKVKSFPSRIKYISKKEAKLPLMELEKAKSEVWEVMKNLMEKQGRQFVFDQYNKILVAGLTKYFTWQKSSPYDIEKGLWLFGAVGAGKTFLLQVFEAFTNKFKLPTAFDLHNIKTIAAQTQQEGIKNLRLYSQGFVAFDDVGFEIPVKYMGNQICVFSFIMNEIYKKHTTSGKISLVTTNLLPTSIAPKYGERIEDRLKQMFNFVCLGGNSKR